MPENSKTGAVARARVIPMDFQQDTPGSELWPGCYIGGY
jgi:hypothetical protein